MLLPDPDDVGAVGADDVEGGSTESGGLPREVTELDDASKYGFGANRPGFGNSVTGHACGVSYFLVSFVYHVVMHPFPQSSPQEKPAKYEDDSGKDTDDSADDGPDLATSARG